jgi:hypothetical protein
VSDEAVIKSSQGARSIELTAPVRSKGSLCEFTATIRAEGLSASKAVYVLEADGLASLFEEMASEWRGWKGAKEWGAVEGDFTLSGTHDGVGTLTIRASLWHYVSLEWSASVEIEIDAGEQLVQTASAVRRFVGG